MECILLRHGIAEDREVWKGTESERPLTKLGVQKTREAVAGLKNLGIQPTHLLSSPFTRAWQTAEIVAETFELDVAIQVCEELLFHRSPGDLFLVLTKLPKSSCVICVGHEPHLGEAAGVMVFGKTADTLSLKKAGACGMEFTGKPQAGNGTLKWWLTPGQLRQLRPRLSYRVYSGINFTNDIRSLLLFHYLTLSLLKSPILPVSHVN